MGFGRGASVHVEIGEVVAWLVAVDVLADHAGDVLDVGVGGGVHFLVEHGVQFGGEFFGAAQEVDEALFVLGLVPAVLPGVAFGES